MTTCGYRVNVFDWSLRDELFQFLKQFIIRRNGKGGAYPGSLSSARGRGRGNILLICTDTQVPLEIEGLKFV